MCTTSCVQHVDSQAEWILPCRKRIMFVASCSLLKVAWRAGCRHSGTLAEFWLLVSHAFAGAVGFGLLLWEFGSCNEQAVLRNMSFKH